MERMLELPSGQRLERRGMQQLERRGMLELVPLASWWLRRFGIRGVGRQHISLIGRVRGHRRMSSLHGGFHHAT